MKQKYKILAVSGIALVAALVVVVNSVRANPSYFSQPVSTATATTSNAYIAVPGASTSTLTYDTYFVNSLGGYTKTDSASLLIQFGASSTLATLGWQYEYSQDGNDWYGDSFNFSTTTIGNGIRNAAVFSTSVWPFASSTQGSSQIYSINKIVSVSTPTRYVRVKFYPLIGSAPVSVWASFVPVKERSE